MRPGLRRVWNGGMTTSWGAPRWPPNYSSEGGYAPLGLPRPTFGAPRRSRGAPRYATGLERQVAAANDRLVLTKTLGARIIDDAALDQDEQAVGDGLGHLQVLLDEHHAHPFAGELADHADQLARDERGQALRGIVEQEELRIADERARDGQHL